MKNKGNNDLGRSEVAELLAAAIKASPKSQAKIAQEVGFKSKNFLTMVKQGSSKLPIEKVPEVAAVLKIDAKFLLKKCYQEYQPGRWEVLKSIYPELSN